MRTVALLALVSAGAVFSQDISYRTLSGSDPRGAIRISAGSTSQYVDSAGNLWNSDALGYGATGLITSAGAVCVPPFAGTSDSTIYQTARWAQNGTSMSFTFNVFPGTYNLKLLLMETQVTTANTRTFSTTINGTDYGIVDTYALAGARCKATSKTFTITTGPSILLTLTAVKSIAIVQGIEITPTGVPPATADLTNLSGYGLYVDGMPLTGTANEFADSLLRSTTGAVTLPGKATNCYVFHDGDLLSGTAATGASTVDGCIFDIGGTATSATMLDSGATTISHSLVLPSLNGAAPAGPLAPGAFTGVHNTCLSTCGASAPMDTSLAWASGGANDPGWYDPQRNLVLFDSKYLGNAYPRWSASGIYNFGDFVSVSIPGIAWGQPINFRYVNGGVCGGSNPKPLSGANWRDCWQYASLYRIAMSLPDPMAFPPRNTLTVVDDQSIGAHGDTYIMALWKWVRAGYAPTNPYYLGKASDGYDSGVMSVVFNDPLSVLSAINYTSILGGKTVKGGHAKLQAK